MMTVKELLQSPIQSSPDGKHWEPAIPDTRCSWWRSRLRDALAVWMGDAIAVRQTTKDDLSRAGGTK